MVLLFFSVRMGAWIVKEALRREFLVGVADVGDELLPFDFLEKMAQHLYD
jgi:hypothetical protein